MATLTKKKAISECKKLWAEIEKSGLSKYEFLDSPEGRKWRAKCYRSNCPLCDYAGKTCHNCPLRTQYSKFCSDLGFISYGQILSTPEWFKTIRGLK